MKRKLSLPKRPLTAGLLLLFVMAALSAAAALIPLLFPAAYAAVKGIMQWGLLPLASAATACLFARSGVTCYLAWLPPPVLVGVVPWLVAAYPLAPGVMLLCAFLAMIGASTGEVMRKRQGKDD